MNRCVELARAACIAAGCCAIAVALASCGGAEGPAGAARPQSALLDLGALDPVLACTSLLGKSIDASAIALPTSGANVLTATAVPGTTGFCAVTGVIRPVDPSAQDITFQVDLPDTWNGKGFQFGGGGFDGSYWVPSAAGTAYNSLATVPTPLARGYVTFSSDGGHPGEPMVTAASAAFALNGENLRNYAGEALKKVHDVASALATLRYGRPLGGTYFVGGSKGGQEALAAAQRWPSDYDGVVATHPAWSFVNSFTAAMRFTQASLTPGGFLDVTKQQLLYDAVIGACDAQDGLADEIVSNPDACHFDPATLRCPGGLDTGLACLSDSQIATVRMIASPFQPAWSAKNGISGYPGWPILTGADPKAIMLGTVGIPSPNPTLGPESLVDALVTGFIKYFVVQDPNYDQMQFDTVGAGGYAGRLLALSDWLDASDSLAPFFQRGGKLILVHGTADNAVSPQATVQLLDRIKQDVGEDVAGASTRFFVIPGFAHIGGTFALNWDPVTAIENWVELGIPPDGSIATDAGIPRTRPMCLYGTYPRYNGTGDSTMASSFTCVPTSQ
jgi:feruloyl esterase